MAIGAPARVRVFPGGHGPVEAGGMAPAAGRVVVPHRVSAARYFVRVVAGSALKDAIAFEEALRSPHSVHGVYDLELVIPSRAWGVVEEEPVSAERLAGPVCEWTPVVPSQ
jgi:hypothetical protein